MEQSSANAAPAAADGLGLHTGIEGATPAFAQVWGDTVDLAHLAWSVVIGIAISVGAFVSGKAVLSHFVSDPAIARAYAMLIGLGGCLAAGALCAVLFRPKRIVVEHAVDDADRLEVLERLAEERGGIGSLADLPPSAVAELKELGLFELFASYEVSSKTARAGEH